MNRLSFVSVYVLLVALGFCLTSDALGELRVMSRRFPSVFQAWNGIENRNDEDEFTRLARHDLIFTGTWMLRVNWRLSPEQPYRGLATELVNQERGASLLEGLKRRNRLRQLNPKLKILCELRYREGRYLKPQSVDPWKWGDYPAGSDVWLRDGEGELAPGWGEDADGDGQVERHEIRFMLLDFRNETLQDLLAQKALALQKSGLFDGIMLDWWKENHATSGRWPNWNGTILTVEEETAARISILQKIRALVGDDFLILVNSNDSRIPQSAAHVNGLFMELYKPRYNAGYELDQLKRAESTLLWAEDQLREPRINCLEGWRVVKNYQGDRAVRVAERDSPENRQWMRLMTCLSLTHSDGYLLFADDNALPSPDHLHNWYAFWDADLGRPLGPKGMPHDSTEGLFVRRFERGWAVYNRSGAAQSISFERRVSGLSKGGFGSTQIIAHGDGEIFLNTSDDR
jgi:hypothetical protein